MFIHMVLFRIQKRHVPVYKKDCRMWESEARRHKGFLACHTLQRVDDNGQYASFYMWRAHKDHTRFMNKHHDRLMSSSHCPVKVLGYYNLKEM